MTPSGDPEKNDLSSQIFQFPRLEKGVLPWADVESKVRLAQRSSRTEIYILRLLLALRQNNK